MPRTATSGLAKLPAFALFASGIAGVVVPEKVAIALDIPPVSSRGMVETRAGLGGTFAALGGWALVSRSPASQTAVGMTWLGAAVVRIGSFLLDPPETDWTFWAYLAGEVGLGSLALLTRSASVKAGTETEGETAGAT